MRGAQPDAECPRCHHRQPPAEGPLATCLKCGLAFQPKELLQRTKKPTVQPNAAALSVLPPAALTIDEAGNQLTYRWSDHPNAGWIAAIATTMLGMMLWGSTIGAAEKWAYSIYLVGFAIYGMVRARRIPQLVLDNNYLKSSTSMLRLADLHGIDVDGNQIIAKIRHNKSQLVLETRDPEIAAFIGDDLGRRLRLDSTTTPLKPPTTPTTPA